MADGSSYAGAGQILLLILYLAAILVGVYYATRFLGKVAMRGGLFSHNRASGGFRLGKYVKLRDRLMLDKGKSLIVIEYQHKQYLLGMTEQSVVLIKECDPEPEEDEAQKGANGQGIGEKFKDIYAAWKKQKS